MKRLIAFAACVTFCCGCGKQNPVSNTPGNSAIPYMYSEIVVGQNLYVACQRLIITQGAYGPAPAPGTMTGLIVVASTQSDAVVDTISLTEKNPAAMDTAGGFLFVSSTGAWGVLDGGVEKINLSTGANAGVVAAETAFGGDISSIAMVSPTKGYVCVMSSTTYTNEVRSFNPSNGTVGAQLTGLVDASGGLAFDGTYLYVGERNQSNPGIVVFNATTDSMVSTVPIDVGLPPYALSVFKDPSTQKATSIIATTSDYTSGNLSVLTIAGFGATNNLLSIHGDNNVVTSNGAVYIIERLGTDRISRFNGVNGFAAAPAWARNLTPGVNVYAMAFADSTKGYATQYGSTDLAVINLATGATLKTIDLGIYGATE